MVAPSIVALGTRASSDPGTTVAPTIPASATTGDLLVVHIFLDDDLTTITGVPTGWTQVGTLQSDDSSSTWVGWAVTTSGGSNDPSATPQWTASVSDQITARIIALSGADTTTPIDDYSQASTGSTVQTWTLGAVTTTVADTLLIGFNGIDAAATGQSFTNTGSKTEQWDEESTGGFLYTYCITETQASTGTYDFEVTFSGTADYQTGFILAIAPGGAATQTISPGAVGLRTVRISS